MKARTIIDQLRLEPHPEGGWYRETWRGPAAGERACATAIHFLLEAGQRSHWHRIDASEIWLHQAGAALELSVAADGDVRTLRLGTDLVRYEQPQFVVPPHAWQSARTTGEWTLVACVVSPGFEFEHFELAAPGWSPERD